MDEERGSLVSRARLAGTIAALAVAGGCASTPLAWQKPETGALAPAAELAECRDAAVREVNRHWPWFRYGPGAWGLPWRRDPFWPGWGPRSFAYSDPSRLELIQDLTAFCLRSRGYRLLPLPKGEPDKGETVPSPADGGAPQPP